MRDYKEVWIEAYEEAIDEGLDNRIAVEFANTACADFASDVIDEAERWWEEDDA